ncbi:MAG TPA: FecR family protein [Kofleriaceae bacterium]|nr:FecR family protein [Kofleriaceae bacterium]
MSNPERPPIEPLSDVAWSRVERNVWSHLDATEGLPVRRSHRRWWLAAPLAAAALAAVALLMFHTPARPGRDDGPTRVVSEASSSSVSLGDAHIALDPHSAIVMDSHAGAPNVLVEHGAAWFAVEPRGSRPPFVVIAGDMRVRVIGTRFRVARDAERIEVEVDHGIVEVGYHGELVRVTNGQHWSSDAPSVVAAIEPLPAPAPVIPSPEVPAPAPVAPAPAAPAPSVAHPATPTSSTDRDATKYAELARLEASAPNAAMAGYLALSKGSGRWAQVALYAAGRLAADRGEARAMTFLEIYLRRFPHGANADDARQLLTRLKGTP